jgi:hypothetical protein
MNMEGPSGGIIAEAKSADLAKIRADYNDQRPNCNGS